MKIVSTYNVHFEELTIYLSIYLFLLRDPESIFLFSLFLFNSPNNFFLSILLDLNINVLVR